MFTLWVTNNWNFIRYTPLIKLLYNIQLYNHLNTLSIWCFRLKASTANLDLYTSPQQTPDLQISSLWLPYYTQGPQGLQLLLYTRTRSSRATVVAVSARGRVHAHRSVELAVDRDALALFTELTDPRLRAPRLSGEFPAKALPAMTICRIYALAAAVAVSAGADRSGIIYI